MRACWIAGACVVALVGWGRPLQAQPRPYIEPGLIGADASEREVFLNAVSQLDQRVSALQKKGSLLPAEFAAVQTEAAALKAMIPRLERSISGSISKLKAAGKWTPDLDRFVAEEAKSKGLPDQVLRGLKTQGGARAVMERTLTLIPRIAPEVDKEVKALEGKSSAMRLLEELLGKPVDAGLMTTAYNCAVLLVTVTDCVTGWGGCDRIKRNSVRCVY